MAKAKLSKLFNRSTQPLVPDDVGWGGGVVMPGEFFKTASPEGYAPDQSGSPWTVDQEAEAALARPKIYANVPPTHMLAGAEVQPAEPQDKRPADKAEGDKA